MKIGVMGTGGVGGYFGGLLARAGHEVTFVTRGAHLEAIKTKGLRIESVNHGTFTVQGPALEDTTRAGEQDLVLFAVKMYDNAKAIEATRPMVGLTTIILTLQNGIDNGTQLAQEFGEPRIMIGCAYLEARIKEPGVITQAGPGAATFGELSPGTRERGRRLLEVFREAGWGVELEKNMTGMLWKKFASLAGSAPVCAASNSTYGQMRSVPETRRIIEGAIQEILAVGQALDAPVMDDSLQWAMTFLDNFPDQGLASLAKDFREGKRVELEGLTGTVVRLGQEAGVPTPINDTLYGILKPWATRLGMYC